MNITCNREQLLAAFGVAATVAPTRTPKAVLQNIKLESTPEHTLLMATDLEVGIRLEVPGIEVETPGSVLLPVQRFGMILRESGDKQLRIRTDARGTTIRGERSEFRLPTSNADEFPNTPSLQDERYHELPARAFRELIRRTIFATDTESTRYALGGVLLEFEADKIVAVGTDGRRLAKMEAPARMVGEHRVQEGTTIVPSRSMQLIERALDGQENDVRVASRTNDILVRSERATVRSPLVEGRFPRWRDVLPDRSGAVRIDLAVGPLYAALRQAATVASEESRGIEFTFDNGSLVLAGLTAEVGQSRVELPVAYTGDSLNISLDNRYVSEFLKVLDPQKNVTLEVEGPDAAALFLTEDGYAYVVMPMARDGQ